MGKQSPMRFSILSLLILVTFVALAVRFMQAPDRTASRLIAAIKSVDHGEIRRLCTRNCAEKVIQELEQHPLEKLYTQKHVETIRDEIVEYEPHPKCSAVSTNWRQRIGRSRQLRVLLDGKGRFLIDIQGSKAHKIEEESFVFSFTYPVLR